MKNLLARWLAAVTRLFIQYAPSASLRVMAYDRIVRRYFLWRDLRVVALTRFGATFEGSLRDGIQNFMYFFGVHEPGLTKVFRMQLKPGDICIDIGANVGAHTLLAAHLVGSGGQVHAVEASPTIHARLLRNLARNDAGHVRTYNVAVTDVAGPVTVFMHGDQNSGATTIMADVAQDRHALAETEIQGLPLADILDADVIANARLVKIDVEGAEWLVLQGMRDTLGTMHEDCLVLMEINKDALAAMHRSIDDILELFGAHGFEAVEIANEYTAEFYARPPSRVLTGEPRRDADIIDVGFARPGLKARLLDADRG